jgi:tetratricopeptide (TPR) repeat protein
MTWLAQSGQRPAALAQFELCRQILAGELAVEPAGETMGLVERIRRGELEPPPAAAGPPPMIERPPPAFLRQGAEHASVYVAEPFVGREPQLARLDGFLAAALAGQGGVAFVSAEAGWGKTRLLEAFTQRALAAHPDLIVATGLGTAAADAGDPFLPFRDILRMLAANVEQQWLAGSISHCHALRLWRFFPRVVEALARHGPHLVGAFVPQKSLLQGAAAHDAVDPALRQQLGDLARQAGGQGGEADRERIFEEIGDVLQALARQQPLLLILDDLHWADPSSVSLLFHLARRLQQCPLLILGAYRPEELALPRAGREHPLAAPLAEFRRMFGDVWLELDRGNQEHDQAFVDALLDLEPNLLGRTFRSALLRHTGGHPLFVAEILRDMKERGDLLHDAAGRWAVGPALNWNVLPARVEGVIETRIGRLDAELRGVLDAASVEGETFTAQVVARALGVDARRVVMMLDREGSGRYRLVQEQGIKQAGGQRLSIYRFRHHLFQRYLYSVLSQSRRAYLHEDVAGALETLYGEQAAEIASELAAHFQAAGDAARAIPYLYQAGLRASHLAADAEAIALLNRGLDLLQALPPSHERSRQALDLQIALGAAQGNTGDITAALATFQQAAAAARALGAWHDLARAALGYEEARWRYNLPAAPAVALLEEALRCLEEQARALRVRLMGGLVRARIASGAADGVEAMAQDAVAAARSLDDPLALFDTLRIYLFADRQPSGSAARLAAAGEMVSLAEAMGNRERLAEALGSRIHEHLECGDIAAFDADLAYRTQVIEPATQPFFLHTNALFHAARSILAGDFAAGERQAQQALQEGQRIGTENAASAYGMQMATIRREQGRLAALAPVIQHFVQQNPASATWLPGLALIYSDLGWQREAREVLDKLAIDDFAAIARDAFWVSSLVYLSEVCAALHDTARAAILYPLLLPHRDRTVVVGLATVCYGAAARYLGQLAATLARWDEAERHFEDALALNTRLGARPWLAHTQHDYAAMLLARGCPADQPRSRALLAAASTTAAELGMRALADKCAASRET